MLCGISWSSIPLSFCFVLAVLAASGKYKVFRILVANEDQLKFISQLRTNVSEDEMDFWKLPSEIGAFADVMVPTSVEGTLRLALDERGFLYECTISDVRSLIQEKETQPGKVDDVPVNPRFRRDTYLNYDFKQYQSYDTMTNYMRDAERYYPNIARTETIGYTREGRPIESLKIGKNLGSYRRMIWIDAGIHAREWPTNHAAMFFMHQLLTQYDKDPEITYLVDNLQWIITPSLNPDGYVYSRSLGSDGVENRMWRKNRSPMACKRLPISGRQRCCQGVDLNRNFDFHWGTVDSSDNPCNEVYHGEYAFSEPETRAVRDAIMKYKDVLDGVITMHNYGQIWSHPYGHERGVYPPDRWELEQVSRDATGELQKLYGTSYRIGSAADAIYPASGGLDDWSKAQGVKYVFLLELRPNEYETDGFILDQSQLLPTAKETWEGVKVVAREVLRNRGQLPSEQTLASWRSTNSKSTNVCADRHPNCDDWVRQNRDYCTSVRDYMAQTCPMSCNLCPSDV
jgi:hypothetical protein